jgi:asparagine synthase (glutamine-hydrolysing)
MADKLHHIASRVPRLSSLFGSIATRCLPVTFNKVSWDYKARKFFQASRLPFSEAHYHWRTIFSEAEKRSLLKPEYAKSLDDRPSLRQFEKFFNEVPDCHFLDQAMYVDVKTWLVDDILVKADRMSMAHSLELRSPLLDYRIAEFAASLPTGLKLKGFRKKYILKRSQAGILPNSTIHRKKRGFNAPIAHWLESGLQDLLVGAFKEGPVNDIINVGVAESLLKAHLRRTEDASFKLFNLLTLAFWINSASHKNNQISGAPAQAGRSD